MAERKKLIEVALPLEAINRESAREKSIRHGHPSTIHIWWARRPLAACRAIIFASLVDDPSTYIMDDNLARKERKRLASILERFVKWENSNNSYILDEARQEIVKSIARTKGIDLADKISSAELSEFIKKHAPMLLDPFCGGGSIPLEGQRIGLRTFASDLNPVAVLITKALIEIPSRFVGNPPVNPKYRKDFKEGGWKGASGLAEDVRHYGKLLQERAQEIIGHLYPKIRLPEDVGKEEAEVIAWLWARTIECPNLACRAKMPLISSYWLSKKNNNIAWLEPILDRKNRIANFNINNSEKGPSDPPKKGRGAKFSCIFCNEPVQGEAVKKAGIENKMGIQLLAIVAKADSGRYYLPANSDHALLAENIKLNWAPDEELPYEPRAIWCTLYGLKFFRDLFTNRQLTALITLSDLLKEIYEIVKNDAIEADFLNDNLPMEKSGKGAKAYADAIVTYLALAIGRLANRSSTICIWNTSRETIEQTFARQAIPMTWDFAEANVFGTSTGSWLSSLEWIPRVIERLPSSIEASVRQLDAINANYENLNPFVCTDPPYYDNIGYSDLSDFFYIWLRRSLSDIYPDLFSTLLTPKIQEMIANPYRFNGSKKKAKEFFEDGFVKSFEKIMEIQNPEYPMTLYYAFKQAEIENNSVTEDREQLISSTGWETMLRGLIKAGFRITGTWPMHTERDIGLKKRFNVLASSIILVCRPRSKSAPIATRREIISELRIKLPIALKKLQDTYIAPVDLAQAAIGPGFAIFSKYAKVLEADGSPMSVKTALQIINQELEAFFRQEEGELDVDTQFCISWFEQYGIKEGPFGKADVLARAKNMSVEGLVRAGIINSRARNVAIVSREDYEGDWDPITDSRLTLWECTQHLIKQYQEGGEKAAATLVSRLGSGKSEDAKNLAYRLYSICERNNWADEARTYNELVTAWPEIQKKAASITGEGAQKIFDVE